MAKQDPSEVRHWPKRHGDEYNSENRIMLRICTGKRDLASNIIHGIELYYEIYVGKRELKSNIIWKLKLYFKFAIGKRDARMNTIWKSRSY